MANETDAAVFRPPVARSKLSAPNYEISKEDVVVSVKDVIKFKERHYLATHKFEYSRNASDPGLVLIFNQEEYNSVPRKGSNRDVNEIVICFQRLGFNIERDINILTVTSKEQILEKVENICKEDLSEYNSLIVFFMSHGDDCDMLKTSTGTLYTTEIWSEFSACKTLEGKPKMFIFQACKGESSSTTGNQKSPFINTDSKLVSEKMLTMNLGPDMLIVYSTIEGNVSFRNAVTGSWFIQELCKNFAIYGKRDDVISLLIRTTKCVCGNYFHRDLGVNKKQMPSFISTLTRKFYLNRNKDRDLMLKISEQNEKILELLTDIKQCVCNIDGKINDC